MIPKLLPQPVLVRAAGDKPKVIEEFIGRVSSGTQAVSVARMKSPPGWAEPGQTPEFDEYTLVLRGLLRVAYKGGALEVQAGQAVVAPRGEWVQYSTPGPEGAEYVAVCLPAFSPDTVRRDGDPVPEETAEARRARIRAQYRLLGRIFVWSGWIVAAFSLWLGSRLINGLHGRVVELQKAAVGLKNAP